MLAGLKLPTDPRWVNLAEKKIEDILTDHAYCEQKAASTAISLIVSFIVPEQTGHQLPLLILFAIAVH